MFCFYFDIESEIAHFRDPTSHAFLNTFLAPPPHAILGLIGSCAGYTESETEELGNKIKIGCVIRHLNGFLKDLTITENQKYKTQIVKMPRMRRFLVGPKYRIYVGSEDKQFLTQVQGFVKKPQHSLYLGISDCLAYIRGVSKISKVKTSKFKKTSSVVMIESDNKYSTTLKEENQITVSPQIIKSPTSYVITEMGRRPENFATFLMAVNCTLSFRKPIDGIELNGENVCLV